MEGVKKLCVPLFILCVINCFTEINRGSTELYCEKNRCFSSLRQFYKGDFRGDYISNKSEAV